MAGLCEGGNEPPGSLKASLTAVPQPQSHELPDPMESLQCIALGGCPQRLYTVFANTSKKQNRTSDVENKNNTKEEEEEKKKKKKKRRGKKRAGRSRRAKIEPK
ncbi:hypothetical protein ANN_10865 [Periplaneta americana]|uniref:Uncharacterized protein n=1 Tax=Periplaneta americana TaxID=6978 RepID=A0ABQ8T4U0_PERAM|nr:hypothetical protein ANN_10865 [Periplaneta americana]